ncbi:MAG: DNA alkylation repair protein [Candidatus Nomurabacteria bacterium]|nr:DNA alkylation repair protein [Candidatus Nomurabacteria bacterium]
MKCADVQKELKKFSSLKRKKSNEWYFKTGEGDYGHGDKFVGVSMPDIRVVSKKFIELSLLEIKKLLSSKIHEERMVALVILSYQIKKTDKQTQKKIYNFYLNNTKYINNWDLVDVTVNRIVGAYLWENKNEGREILYKFARSKNMWERRIAIIATSYFIYQNNFVDTFKIAKILLNDKEDLLHKAVGWMLREVGKRDQKTEEAFLKKYYKKMPRVMLRYAIEKFPETRRKAYLKGMA